MTEFHEAAEELRTAQLLKLNKELQQERAMHCVTHALAVDRSERIIELARVGNALRDERDRLLADSKRLAFLVEHQAVVEESKTGGKFWLVYPDGYVQMDMYNSPAEAVDAAMENENV